VAGEVDVGRRGRADTVPVEAEQRRRFGFVGESWAELKKVEWPTQSHVVQGSVVVIVACAIVGLYLWLNDQVWKQVVEKFLLGQ
jgi:preprotein translocase subunit SecE